MKHIAALATCPLLLAVTTTSSVAATVSHGGEVYDTVSWLSIDNGLNQASGDTPSNSVFFSTGSFAGSPPHLTVRNSADYASDPSFDALSYDPGDIESLDMFAISPGVTTITLGNGVNSLLLFIGTANSFTPGLNSGQWEFGPEWTLTILDTDNDLEVTAGNVLRSSGGAGSTGAVRIARTDDNPFNVISFSNPSGGGGGGGGGGPGDGMSLGMAFNQIPEPSCGLLSFVRLVSLMVRRRR